MGGRLQKAVGSFSGGVHFSLQNIGKTGERSGGREKKFPVLFAYCGGKEVELIHTGNQ